MWFSLALSLWSVCGEFIEDTNLLNGKLHMQAKVYTQFQEIHKHPPMCLKTLKDEQDISRYNPNLQGAPCLLAPQLNPVSCIVV